MNRSGLIPFQRAQPFSHSSSRWRTGPGTRSATPRMIANGEAACVVFLPGDAWVQLDIRLMTEVGPLTGTRRSARQRGRIQIQSRDDDRADRRDPALRRPARPPGDQPPGRARASWSSCSGPTAWARAPCSASWGGCSPRRRGRSGSTGSSAAARSRTSWRSAAAPSICPTARGCRATARGASSSWASGGSTRSPTPGCSSTSPDCSNCSSWRGRATRRSGATRPGSRRRSRSARRWSPRRPS